MIKVDKISKEYIKNFLPENPIILEAGAHIGRDTIKMAKLWPNSKIYAFEPVPELFKELEIKAKKFNNIFCYNLALGQKNEPRKFFVSSGRSTAVSSLYEPGQELKEENIFNEINVDVVNLDNWAKENKIKKIDFMWLDMQGAELEVLEAAPTIIKNTQVLLIEANLSQRYKNISLYQEIIDKISLMGFEPIAQDAPRHEKVNILFKKIVLS